MILFYIKVVNVTVPLCLLFIKDKLFTLNDAECLGPRVSAPTMQTSDEYCEDLTVEHVNEILDDLKVGKESKATVTERFMTNV